MKTQLFLKNIIIEAYKNPFLYMEKVLLFKYTKLLPPNKKREMKKITDHDKQLNDNTPYCYLYRRGKKLFLL